MSHCDSRKTTMRHDGDAETLDDGVELPSFGSIREWLFQPHDPCVLGPRRVGDRDAARRFNEARWSLLKAPERLNDEQAATLRQLRRAGGEVWRAYTLKEALRAIFQPGLTIEDVTVLIDRFISKALRSRLAPFVRLAQTIRKHRDGILQAIRLGINKAAPKR